MGKVSITRLTEYAQVVNQPTQPTQPTPPQEEPQEQALPYEPIEVTTTRRTAEWLLADLAKRGKRLHQSVAEPKTCAKKRGKREAELQMLSLAVEALTNALNNQYNGQDNRLP